MADLELPLSAHLEELRSRLGRALLATIVAFAICYPRAELVFRLLTDPLHKAASDSKLQATLIGTGVAEAFFTRLKVAFIAALFLALPVLLYQAWMFIAPGLKESEARYARLFVLFGTVFFLAGSAFCYFVVFPYGLPFLLDEYTKIGVAPTIRISEYLSFSSQMLLAFGMTFEMPVATFFLARVGLLTHHTLIRYMRHAILVLFIASAILTPPDVASMIMMVIPLLGLYTVSIGVAYLARRPTPADASD